MGRFATMEAATKLNLAPFAPFAPLLTLKITDLYTLKHTLYKL